MPENATEAGRPLEGDTQSAQAAAEALRAGVRSQGAFVPPRVTLTIELGTLTPDSVKAITKFVNGVLSVGPSAAVGDASGRDIADLGLALQPAQGGEQGGGGAQG